MNRKRLTLLIITAVFVILAAVLTACIGSNTAITITFDSKGGSDCQSLTLKDGDSLSRDDFPVPTKSGYTFDGWYIDKDFETSLIDYLIENTVKKSFTAYAKWVSDAHNIWVLKNAEGGEVTGEGKYSEGAKVTLTAAVAEPEYHTWEGWYDAQNNLLCATESYSFIMGLEVKTIYARWICKVESEAVFYKNYGEDDNTIYFQRTAGYRENNIQIPVPERENYYFTGWNTQRDGNGQMITEAGDRTIINDYAYKTETCFYAVWTINTYSAESVDATSVKITAYNGIEPCIFIPDALNGKTVVALSGLANSGVKEIVVPYTVSAVDADAVEGVEKIYLAPDSQLSPDDGAFANTEVYVSVVNYDSDKESVSYYCYMDGIFADTELDNEEEHIAFFKYLRLYNIIDEFRLHCAYDTGWSDFSDYCRNLTSKLPFYFKSNLHDSYGCTSSANYVTYKFALKDSEYYIGSATSDGGAMQTQGTAVYVNYSAETSEHTFSIDSLSPIAVYNSEQLVSAVERGFKPIFPQSGTTAEAAYVKAKEALSSFIGNGMTDLEKIKAIHDYIALNVTYDSWVLDNYSDLSTDEVSAYRAFYIEGVFLDKKAVCDGIAKAFMLMCRMEGINAVRASGYSYHIVSGENLPTGYSYYYYSEGNLIEFSDYDAACTAKELGTDIYAKSAGHAWNKVCWNGYWYCVDVTKDDAQTTSSGTKYEFLNHLYFMRSDSEFVKLGNLADDDTTAKYSATLNYGYYTDTEYKTGANLAPSQSEEYTALAKHFRDSIGIASGLYSIDFYSTFEPAAVLSYFSDSSYFYTQQEYGEGYLYVVMEIK